MLSRMDGAIDAENLLSGRYRGVVNPAWAKDIETGAEPGPGEKREARAARSAMQIQAESRTKTANLSGARREDGVDVGIAFEDFAEAVLYDGREAKIGAVRFQQMQSGSGKNAIAEGAQPDDRNSIAGTKSFENIGSRGQAATRRWWLRRSASPGYRRARDRDDGKRRIAVRCHQALIRLWPDRRDR